jgi:hypothetical protein
MFLHLQKVWSRGPELNRRPDDYESSALPAELPRLRASQCNIQRKSESNARIVRVLRKGFIEAAQDWVWANCGVRWPIRRVTFAVEREHHDLSGFKRVAVFRFLNKDWSPWVALLHMGERWPGLSFKSLPYYPHMVDVQ